MRTAALVVIALGVYGLSACKDTESTMSRDLSEDLALAASNDGLNLISPSGGQGTVSALEQTERSSARLASSQRSRVSKAVVTPQASVQLAVRTQPDPVAAPEAEDLPAPQPVPEPQAIVAPEPVPVPAPRPQPVAVESPTSGDAGSDTGRDIGRVIGVVLRGGVVNGDHCDPRTDRRRGGHIAINNRIPTPRTF